MTEYYSKSTYVYSTYIVHMKAKNKLTSSFLLSLSLSPCLLFFLPFLFSYLKKKQQQQNNKFHAVTQSVFLLSLPSVSEFSLPLS